MICGYCENKAELVTGKVLHPSWSHLADRMFWRCVPCQAHVGCHEKHRKTTGVDGITVTSDGTLALGSLANAELREARSEVHKEFDPIWHYMPRKKAYAWLANELGIDVNSCHIAMFDLAMCKKSHRDFQSGKARNHFNALPAK